MTANMIKTQMSSTIMKNKKSFDDDCCCYAKTLKTTAQTNYQMYYLSRGIKGHNVIIIMLFLLVLLTSSFGIMAVHYAYGQASQVNLDKNNNTNLLNVQNIPAKKIHVGDIDIAYKANIPQPFGGNVISNTSTYIINLECRSYFASNIYARLIKSPLSRFNSRPLKIDESGFVDEVPNYLSENGEDVSGGLDE